MVDQQCHVLDARPGPIPHGKAAFLRAYGLSLRHISRQHNPATLEREVDALARFSAPGGRLR